MKSNESLSPILILCDIRSNENVGSIFRTADAVGIKKLYLTGITPAPIDRFGRAVGTIAKTALGAEKTVPWEKRENIDELLLSLCNDGYAIVAIEQSPKSVDYKSVELKEKIAFVLGSEVEGLPQGVLDQADTIAEIPMRGTKESLNVAVAAGVALFRILDR